MGAEYGVSTRLTETIEANELRRNQVIPIQVHPKEHNEGVYDKEWPLQAVQQGAEQPERVMLKPMEVNRGVIHERGMRHGINVQPDIHRPMTEGINRPITHQIRYALIGGRYL
jgi:hypothetical protein